MKPDLSGKSILLTGGARGLGRSVSMHLAACGAVLGVADVDAGGCRETVAAITGAGGRAVAFAGDMSVRETFLEIAGSFAGQTGRIDAVINNAMLLAYQPVEEIREELLDRMLGIGVKGSIWGAQALLRHYDRERGGAIINMASPVVVRGYSNTAAYTAVKAAVAGLTRVLAAELGPRGIRVNAVSPASVPTPGAKGMVSDEEYARRAATIPLRRIGHEEDNANAIAFLLSEEAGFVNGEIFNVDGGVAACGD